MNKPDALVGIVHLIGAGPGDPGLISVRGMQRLGAADVVLYDHLVDARLLRHARADAEKIDLGPAAPKRLDQEAICCLIVEKAREGKTVARLKWGDPFVFDDGGAEALFLHEQGVRFEVVPGIPAGIGIPSYAGIPVTYPGGGDTLALVRGHEDDGEARTSIDWARLAHLDCTIVCYAGPHQVPKMLNSLLSHGRSPDDSAALIYDGTLPTQQTIVGTLSELAAAVKASSDRRTAILVVGRVTGLREHLRWFDARPLFGKRVLVTRPKDQSAEMLELLEDMGAETIEAPMIQIVPPDDFGPLDEACALAATFDWIIFTSANAVDTFVRRLLASPLDLRELKGVKLCVVGAATAQRLTEYGLKPDLVPSEYRAESVLSAISASGDVARAKVLLPRADIGRELLADELRKRGAEVTEVVAYRTIAAEPERDGDPDVFRLLLERRVDVVTFTSPSAVRNFVNAFGPEPAADLLRHVAVASIGPVTAEAAAQYGIQTAIVPAQYTVPALVNAIVEYVGKEKQEP